MSTFLFDKIVFGPVQSRRLGVSLGINLLPTSRKVCNFDCIYCECGLNSERKGSDALPTREQVSSALAIKLQEMRSVNETPDVITFAGNGEPTLHPQFAEIISDTLALRNLYFPKAQVSVLSNSTMLFKPDVVEALKQIDQNILKLDSGIADTIKTINQPIGNFDYTSLIANLKQFKGKLIIQTMFIRGQLGNQQIDNTTETDLLAWENALQQIKPQQVMLYSIDRETPHSGLQKIPLAELKEIGERIKRLQLDVKVFG